MSTDTLLPEGISGQIYLDVDNAPLPDSLLDDLEDTQDDATPFLDSELLNLKGVNFNSTEVFEHTLARWKDLSSPPHTKLRCDGYSDLPFGGKTCTSWKTKCKHLYNTAILRVTVASPRDVKAAVNDCLKTAAVAAAISSIIGSPKAAIPAATKALKYCLLAKFGDELIDVSIKVKSRRSRKWESC